MIVLLHAYSRRNSGDGLLVDASLALIEEAIPHDTDIRVVALDPASFSDMNNIVEGPTVAATFVGKIAAAFLAATQVLRGLFRWGGSSNFDDLVSQANLIVGVGGGYLRSGTLKEGLKACLAHGPQSFAASNAKAKSVYLPQSVGPLRGLGGATIKSSLRGIDRIFLRDDRSIRELGDLAAARRAPDLALLELSQCDPVKETRYDKVYIVARDQDKSASIRARYIKELKTLRDMIPHAEIVTQSASRGNDDPTFYTRIGWGDQFRTLKEAIEKSGPGVVISVRLHGALQALLRACPAIHLSYERKGFGAFDDLGLLEYVHNSLSFDANIVSGQAIGLCNDSGPYWARVAASVPKLRNEREAIISSLRECYAK